MPLPIANDGCLHQTHVAAAILGVSERMVRYYVQQGSLRAVRLGSTLRFSGEELHRFVNSLPQAGPKEPPND